MLGPLEGAAIAVLGLTYKAGTDTLRRSGAVELAAKMLRAGAEVRCYDPLVSKLPDELAGAQASATIADALHEADAAVVATEWPQIKEADWPALVPTMRRCLVVDANGFLGLRPEQISCVEYFSVGTPSAA